MGWIWSESKTEELLKAGFLLWYHGRGSVYCLHRRYTLSCGGVVCYITSALKAAATVTASGKNFFDVTLSFLVSPLTLLPPQNLFLLLSGLSVY